MVKIRRMFPGGNTADGFYSLHDNILGSNRKMLYILKGMPGGGKSSLMKEIGRMSIERGFSLEYHHCPSDPNSIDGLVIEELDIGIVDGTAPHIIDPVYPGVTDLIIDLGQFIDRDKLLESREEIMKAKNDNKKAYGKAYTYFKAAKTIYDLIEENNKQGVDFNGVNRVTMLLIEEIFSQKPETTRFAIKERHLFSNANTPEGFVDYTEFILKGVKRVFYIKGDIGIGKSTLLNRLIEESRIRNYSMEIYHNSTIPNKVESLIINDINTCITSNEQGLKYAYKSIDLNEYFDERVKDEEDYETYQLLIKKGIFHLLGARKNHEILEKAYGPAIDYNGVDRLKLEIVKEIFK
ncbi:hypothetical protein [Tepidimicrobium xylanilyticum]|uniref:Uncharacterized protein n=1 Tax=Tepidimicrobium xylanilyticum TaxID=1123352 RepID=A0A1H2T661_9FIRM|nr:hypothetical protein [Tepidimicrobium xylanilyticum]GMG96017.1 ATP-binding protein [Tepidimicrobium xylanilyticum]SDW39443.1 hypothetical protein SAMN05660923_00640 [Tepidimicrobium xylanilyticum]